MYVALTRARRRLYRSSRKAACCTGRRATTSRRAFSVNPRRAVKRINRRGTYANAGAGGARVARGMR